MSVLELLALKKLRSFALFPAKKRAKYESACATFLLASESYIDCGLYDRAGECLKWMARLHINKLTKPVDAAMRYMEATRAFMEAGEYNSAFECIQLAVQARTRPMMKHKDKSDKGDMALAFSAATVTEVAVGHQSHSSGNSPGGGNMPQGRPRANSSFVAGSSNDRSPGGSVISLFAPLQPSRSSLSIPAPSPSGGGGQRPSRLLSCVAPNRSPVFTAQAGTFNAEGKSVYLSPETMQAPISQMQLPTPTTSTRTLSIQNRSINNAIDLSSSTPSSPNMFGMFAPPATSLPHSSNSSSASSLAMPLLQRPSTLTSSLSATASSSASSSAGALPLPPTSRPRRHSLSDTDSSLTAVAHSALHIDLLLARLAVVLGTHLWADEKSYRDAILALEIAASLFAALLMAERSAGTLRRRTSTHQNDSMLSIAITPPMHMPIMPKTRMSIISSNLDVIDTRSSSASAGSASAAGQTFMINIIEPHRLGAESATCPNSPDPRTPAFLGLGGGGMRDLSLGSSALSPTPQTQSSGQTQSKSTAIEKRLAAMLGPAAYSHAASSQSVRVVTSRADSGSGMLVADSAERPMSSAYYRILHFADPNLSVVDYDAVDPSAQSLSTPRSTYFATESSPGSVSILEESLLCRFQLALYYVTWDDQLGECMHTGKDEGRSEANVELRRSKALFEQVASQRTDEGIVWTPSPSPRIVAPAPSPTSSSSSSSSNLRRNPSSAHLDDPVPVIIYAPDNTNLHSCLFLAGLCDALVGIRQYMASQYKPIVVAPVISPKGPVQPKIKSPVIQPRKAVPVPELYKSGRAIKCPPILINYRAMSPSFGMTCEIRLLRSIHGLLQTAANLSSRVIDALGCSPTSVTHSTIRLVFQTAWGAEILREYTEVVKVYTKQRSLTKGAASIIAQLKTAIKTTIAL